MKVLVGGFVLAALATSSVFSPQVDVSHARGTQAEVSIAVDPSNPRVLLAGSNSAEPGGRVFMRAYSSANGGRSWRSELGPQSPPTKVDNCSLGDPSVAIDSRGRQFFAFLYAPCTGARAVPNVAVARRAGPGRSWTSVSVERPNQHRFDDKPALTIDTSQSSRFLGRLYVVWIRGGSSGEPGGVVISHSVDGGATWSRPALVASEPGSAPWFPSVAVGPTGQVYVAWMAGLSSVEIARSPNGGNRFTSQRLVDRSVSLPGPPCDHAPALSIPAQPKRCASPAPSVVVDRSRGHYRGRVYVTYAKSGMDGSEQDVYVQSFDPRLRQLARRRVNPKDGQKPSDQFFPVAAVDQTTGRLWACYYSTGTGRARSKAWYTCADSSDGGTTWSSPVRAASVSSDVTEQGASEFEYGDYEGLAAANGVAHPIWTDTRNLRSREEEIYTTSIPDSAVSRR